MIGIYKITSPSKKIYIGQSVNIEKRFNTYKNYSSIKQIRLYSSFIKYGVEKHKFEILCECEISELNEKERYYQDLYNVLKNGLNCRLTTASDRSGKLSQETKIKISIAKKGNKNRLGKIQTKQTKIKISLSNKGKIISEKHKLILSKANKGKILTKETKLKISKAKKGIPKTELHKNKLSSLILNIETGIFYFGIKEVAKIINVKPTTLASRLNGQCKNKTNFIYV